MTAAAVQTHRMSLTQYYTATTLDGFIADPWNSLDWLFTRAREEDGPLNYGDFIAEVGAIAMGSTTYEWILDHVEEWPYDMPCWVFTHRGGAPLLPRRIELELVELGRNGDFAAARFAVVRAV